MLGGNKKNYSIGAILICSMLIGIGLLFVNSEQLIWQREVVHAESLPIEYELPELCQELGDTPDFLINKYNSI